jgi:hypothetical protein
MTTKVMDGKRETLAQYLAGVLEGGSDGVGGDWEASEAARAVEYEAEQWLKQVPPTTQPLPDTGGEWRVRLNPGARAEILEGNTIILAAFMSDEHAAQIVSDHNAVGKLVAALETLRDAGMLKHSCKHHSNAQGHPVPDPCPKHEARTMAFAALAAAAKDCQ